MRRLLALLAVVPFATTAPASAAGVQPHVVTILGTPAQVSVTCDTSTYPAPNYLCQLTVNVTTGCSDLSVVGDYSCTLRLSGQIYAIPSADPASPCTFDLSGVLSYTFDSPSLPAFHDDGLTSRLLLQRAEASYATFGVVTPYLVTVQFLAGHPGSGYLYTAVTGAMEVGFAFSDLQPDCRTRAGGDPVSDNPAIGHLVNLGPTGALVFARVT